MDIEAIFDKYHDEYLKFDRVENKRSNRPDLHAFLLLNELFPCDTDRDMISAAAHDIIYLDIDAEDIEKIPEDKLVELIRCGIGYDDDSLCMFV